MRKCHYQLLGIKIGECLNRNEALYNYLCARRIYMNCQNRVTGSHASAILSAVGWELNRDRSVT